MNLIVLADGAVGLKIVQGLLQAWAGDIGLVVTTGPGTIRDLAIESGKETLIFQSEEELLRDCAERRLAFDLGLLAWWPKIVRESLLSLPVQGFLNTHPSLLPFNRGKHYNFWALVEQAPFGVTLHRVNTGVDTGEIVVQKPIDYGWEDTGKTLYEKASSAVVDLVLDAYPSLRSGFHSWPQPEGGTFHRASELDSASRIDLDKSYTGRELLNLLRARTFPPHPACWFKDGDDEYEVRIEIGKRR